MWAYYRLSHTEAYHSYIGNCDTVMDGLGKCTSFALPNSLRVPVTSQYGVFMS